MKFRGELCMLNKDKLVEVITDDTCTNCAHCVSVCPAEYLKMKDNKIKANADSPFGCIQCGVCMMNCPNNSIKIRGQGISEKDLIELPKEKPDFNAINSLFLGRRSIRNFKKQEVSEDLINKILDAGTTAPISIPPSEVKVLVINGQDKVQDFACEITETFDKMIKFLNPVVLRLLKHFMGPQYEILKEFIMPYAKLAIDARKKGEDILLYNAPAIIVFYGSELCEKEDQILAATHASIAAEALGLGTCIIGGVPPCIDKNNKLRKKYGLLKNEKASIAFILGHPDVKFNKGIKRRFKDVKYF